MSLFPEVDKEIEEIKKEAAVKLKVWVTKQEIFTPSNGGESMQFEGACLGCKKNNLNCSIEIEYWEGTPQKEIILIHGEVLCVKHTDFMTSFLASNQFSI